MSSKRKPVVLIAVVCVGAVLFFLSLSREVREITSPVDYGVHLQILLRKVYSVIAFGLLGYGFARWRGARTRNQALLIGLYVAAYSAGIEYVQWLRGSHEGRVWNAADTLMGLVGGLIGSLIAVAPGNARASANDPKT